MPRFLVFTIAQTKLSDHHQPVITTAGTYFLRAVETEADSMANATLKAMLARDETVLGVQVIEPPASRTDELRAELERVRKHELHLIQERDRLIQELATAQSDAQPPCGWWRASSLRPVLL